MDNARIEVPPPPAPIGHCPVMEHPTTLVVMAAVCGAMLYWGITATINTRGWKPPSTRGWDDEV